MRYLIIFLFLLCTNVEAKIFKCKYSGGNSKIEISSNRATETTSAGVVINYSKVELSSKGAYSLSGSSKDTRAWFIGAISFLMLGTNMTQATCR